MRIFEPGEIVKITTTGFNWTIDGWATVGNESGEGVIEIFERVDLKSYPSCDDFKGESFKVKHGDIALILKYIGRPLQISSDPAWFSYDLYEIMIGNKKCQVFKQNLAPVRD
tara:strand:+ start:426 stop:761 length:336 start_codon:yes stop_codon:yes gene_type:complete